MSLALLASLVSSTPLTSSPATPTLHMNTFPTTPSSATPVFHMNSHPIWRALLRLATMPLTKLAHRVLFPLLPSTDLIIPCNPFLTHSVPSPALTDYILSTRQQSLERHTPLFHSGRTFSMATRDAQLPFLDPVQPLFGPAINLFLSWPPNPLMVLTMHSSPSITSLASQHPQNHQSHSAHRFFRSLPPGAGLALRNCPLGDHPSAHPLILTPFAHRQLQSSLSAGFRN